MTMPYGATEEPEVEFVMEQSVAPAVVSSGVKSGKSVAPEFGKWRTLTVANVLGASSSTPGAQQLGNRSERRHRIHILVQPTVANQPTTDGVLVGSKGEINSGQPAVIGSLGGYLPIGTNIRYEAQSELWVCYPVSNTDAVFVTVCDEIYASEG